ncbi:MAG TPA: hypothetical protein VFH90_03170 [Candidatus Limnocylindria bacterium]|nr:hypothetical protein [Candidatus Limnocylindria bacterium]
MNWRAAGCGVLAIGIFLAIGLFGMSLAFRSEPGCPDRVQWADRTYLVDGSPAPSPAFGEPGDAVGIGSTFMGLTTRRVFGPPGSSPSTEADDRPQTVAMDCADGTFQTYRWDGESRTPAPTGSP